MKLGPTVLGFAGVLLLLLQSMAWGQAQNTGTVSGNVTDPQARVLTGAKVLLSLPGQGRQFTAETNEKGEYLFNDVAVGVYTLRIDVAGFEGYVVQSIQVDADQNVRIDAQLQVGAVGAEVTVEASSTVVDTRSATIGTMIDNKLVEELPIDGNNVVSLAALLPGVTNVNAPTSFTSDVGGPTFNVSGSRNNQNMFLFDGLLWNNLFYNTGLNYPPPHALQETSVLLNNFKAQYGRSAGSVYNVLTRGGSDAVHGTLWEYLQNSAFNATDYITQENPKLVSSQFGATVGGPIRRDRAFFFLTFQDLRQGAQQLALQRVPDLAQRGYSSVGVQQSCASPQFAGKTCATFGEDFPGVNVNQALKNPLYSSTYSSTVTSQLNAAWTLAGNTGISPCVTLLNSVMNSLPSPYNKYLPNAEIPTVCFNPVAVNFYNNYLVLPNTTRGGDSHYLLSHGNHPQSSPEGMARVDFNLGRHVTDARFFVKESSDTTANGATNVGVATYEPDANSSNLYFGNIGDTWELSPNLLNVLRAGYKRYAYIINPTDHNTWQSLGSNLAIPGVPELPKVEATNWFTVGGPNSVYSNTINESIEVDDNLSLERGRHNLQGGVQFLRLQYLHRFDTEPFIEAEVQNTGDSIGDFIMGLAYQTNVGNSTNLAAIQHAVYLYAQDDWRITSRLTLNYGLRYELPFPWNSPDRQAVTFVPGYQSQVFPSAPSSMAYEGDPGVPDSIASTKFESFAPRVGFAWDVYGDGNTSFRGGFGIFYDNVNANIVGVGEPYHYSATYSDPLGGFSQPLMGEPAVPQNYIKGQPQFPAPYTVNFADKNLTTPYVESMNFGVQQRLGKSATLEINGVGKLGRKQLMQFDLNPAIYDCSGAYYLSNPQAYCNQAANNAASYVQRVQYPGYNYGGQGIVDNASVATSKYFGLQAIFMERLSKSLNVIASYTWSRSIDLQSNGQTNTSQTPQPNNLRTQYGPSDFNSTHIFNAGWVWKLPSFSKGDRPLRIATGGWSLGGIVNLHTGMPYNVYIAGDQSLTDERPQRPNLVPGVNPILPSNRTRAQKVAEWFNPAAFSTPALGTFGNLSRNAYYGPGYDSVHLSVSRLFPLPHEGMNAQFRCDAFNAFNNANFANPNTQLANSTANAEASNFGTILSTIGTNGAVGTNGRRLQLSLVLHY